MFGMKGKIKIANEFDALADQTQKEIDVLKSQNPFETAAAKSAMAKASQNAQSFYNRGLNVMGANASPEAIVAAQGEAGQAVAGAAGNIAVGAEANRNQQTNVLRNLQQQEMGTAANIKIGAVDTAWDNFFKTLDVASKFASAGGQAASTVMMGGV